MTQTVVLTVAILASLLTGWYVSDTLHRSRITRLEGKCSEYRRRIANLTRDETHA